VTEDGIPFSYDIHSGSNADENTVLANMQKLQNLRAKLADYCEEPLLITGDRKTISDEIVIKYHKQDVQYLAPVTITEDNKEIALSVSDDEFDNNKLAYRDRSKGAYWAVFRPITFKLKNDRKSREKAIKRIESKLIHIESHVNARKYKNPDYVKYMAKKSVVGSRTKKYFAYGVKGEYGRVEFTWGLKKELIEEDEKGGLQR
jgi:transposase